MGKTTLYYGSQEEIRKPIFHFDKPYNDYGLGFYCTREKDVAKEWACPNEATNGIVNTYSIDLSSLRALDLTSGHCTALNWISILIKHRLFPITTPLAVEAKEFLIRNYYIDIEEYDIVVGYRADDSYFSFAKDFVRNVISLEQLSVALTLGNLGKQTVLISQKAFEAISFIESETVDASSYYTKKVSRDKRARKDYMECRNRGTALDEHYIIDIMREALHGSD